jgi:hypothetical protein
MISKGLSAMKSIGSLWTLVIPAIVAVLLCAEVGRAQNPEVGMDPTKCEQLQRQIDSVVSLSNSTSMSESEKVVALAKIWGQAVATMLKNTADDSDAAKIAKEMVDSVTKVMASADTSGASGNKTVSADTERGAKVLKNRLKPYIAVMKMMCPNLVIPDVAR